MSKNMKLIIENFRSFSKEEERKIPEQEMKAMLAQAIHGLGMVNINESDKFFKGMLAGGFMAIAPLLYQAYAQHSEDAERYRAAAAQAAENLSSTKTKVAELDKQVNGNPAAWQWSDDTVETPGTGELTPDPHSTERYPTIDIDQDGQADASVLPPSWSIAMQVLQDKQAGTINVPGFGEGEIPPLSSITSALSGEPTGQQSQLSGFVADFAPYMQNTGDMGAGDIQMIGGVYPANTVAVNPAVFDDMPNYKLDSGMTAQETYIKYFFGQYFGSEEALKYGDIK